MKSSRKHFFLFRVTTQNLFSSGGHQGCLSSLQQNLANDVCAILSHGAGLEAMMGLWRARVSSKKVQGRPLVKVKPQFQWKWQDRRGDGEMLRPSREEAKIVPREGTASVAMEIPACQRCPDYGMST